MNKTKSLIEKLKNGEVEAKPFSQKKKYGFEADGYVIIPPIYTEVFPFKDGLAKVVRRQRYGFVDYFGTEVIPCTYYYCYDFKNNYCVVARNEKEAYSEYRTTYYVIDRDNKKVNNIDPRDISGLYHDFNSFIDSVGDDKYRKTLNLYFDEKLNKPVWSYINRNGEEILSYQYDRMWHFSETITAVEINDKTGLVHCHNRKEILPCEYDRISKLNDGFAITKKNGLFGILDERGNIVISNKYEYLNFAGPELFLVRRGNLMGIIDTKENIILPIVYEEINRLHDWRRERIESILADFEEDRNKSQGQTQVFWSVKYKGLSAVFTNEFRASTDFIYNDVELKNGYLKVRKGIYWGLLDHTFKVVLNLEFKGIETRFSRIDVRKKNLWGICDLKGKLIYDFRYQAIIYGSADWAKKDERWGIIDERGNPLTEFIYSPVMKRSSGSHKFEIERVSLNDWMAGPHESSYCFRVKRNRKYGLINEFGSIIADCIYDELRVFNSKPTAIYNQDGTSKEILGLAKYRKGNYRGYLDSNGKEYWQDWERR